MSICPIEHIPKDKLVEFFKTHWESPTIVISSGIYDCRELDGFAAVSDKGDILGLITYVIRENECEIISLNSVEERKGIGTSLLKEVEGVASRNGCKLVKLITTNDNLSALRFYQKRGFVLSRIINNAVERARKIKPEIPLIGNDGIPIRDEIELVKVLSK